MQPQSSLDNLKGLHTALNKVVKYHALDPPDPSRFLGIPRELRDLIYKEHLIATNKWGEDFCLNEKSRLLDRGTMLPHFLPSIGRVNRQVRSEVTEVILRACSDMVVQTEGSYIEFIIKWLETYENVNSFDWIKRLCVPTMYHMNRDMYKHNPTMHFIMRCSKLRRLSLTFHASATTIGDPNTPIHRMTRRPLNEFMDYYDLHHILGCECLEELRLDGILPSKPSKRVEIFSVYTPIHRNARRNDEDTLETLVQFGRWAKDSFAKKRQTVVVHIQKRRGHFVWWGDMETL
ncbi:hypothetical protein BDV96DRAFT_608128 [Lophiotrema nucula]|uniref:Uncharacterized protein n=1 Tax=Lophiotrema nucula TaxID=690887 RepID=A0A6A5YEL5_9PLEO|nr:hypothetical protein BDV96DRAFT_608128 [Lophiotrema nucula]